MKEQEKALELDLMKEQIAKQCVSTRGKAQLLALTPVFDELWVKRELNRTKEAMNIVITTGTLPLVGMKDIATSVQAAMKGRTLSPQELRDIAQTIHVGSSVIRFGKDHKMETSYIGELIFSMRDTSTIAKNIEHVIGVNYEINDSASPELRSIRKQMQQCFADISKEVQHFVTTHASSLMDTQTTIRNNRTCVLVKVSEKNNIKGFIHGESASGQTAYIEPASLLILNNKLQSLKSREQEEIEKILKELSEEVQKEGYSILGMCETLELLDVIFAKAKWGVAAEGCVADIDDGKHLYLKEARHPLIDPKKVVSNTYEIKEPYQSLLITGSNTGGKTVTLKTIGLFVSMTMCGFALSAKEAVIPFFTKIFTDIGDHQSIQESLSTFSSHVSALARICEHADDKSLVILDELGSGTDPKEGECLAVAVLEELRHKGATILATTHYSQLKSYAKQCEDVLLSCVAFDMEKMQPTYKYLEGISGQSNAFEIAARYHMKPSIIAHAKQLKQQMITEEEKLMEKLEADRILLEHEKEEMEKRLKDIYQLQKELETEKLKQQQEKEKYLEDAKVQAQLIIDETKEEAEQLLDELKKVQSDAKPHVISNIKQKVRNLDKVEEMVDEEKEETFEVGDYVELKKLNYYGEIISLNKGKACVLTNGVKMNTKLSDLRKAVKPQQKKTKTSYQKAIRSSFSMECNLIGLRVEEAIAVLDKYLDNALLAKVYQVRIIHGVGTGALRNGVHSYLKRNAQVESYMMGGQGEGGLGATVVKLKQKGKKK